MSVDFCERVVAVRAVAPSMSTTASAVECISALRRSRHHLYPVSASETSVTGMFLCHDGAGRCRALMVNSLLVKRGHMFHGVNSSASISDTFVFWVIEICCGQTGFGNSPTAGMVRFG